MAIPDEFYKDRLEGGFPSARDFLSGRHESPLEHEASKARTREYNVVFQYTDEAGGYAGARFIRTYADKSELENYMKDSEEPVTVYAQGVSQREAERLCSEVDPAVFIKSAFHEATGEDGEFDPVIAEMHLKTSLLGHLIAKREIERDYN